MARLAAQAKMEYVPLAAHGDPEDPTDSDIARMIASYISIPKPAGQRALDPCTGKGIAIGVMCQQLGIERENIYGNELNDERSLAAAAWTGHQFTTDATADLQVGRHTFQFVYCNPPFDDAAKAAGGGRLELHFFQRIAEGRWVQPGGVVCYVTPLHVFQRPAFVKHLARFYDRMIITMLPDDIRQFNEVIIFGVMREVRREGMELFAREAKIAKALAGTIQDITFQKEHKYTLPEPLKLRDGVIWRDAAQANGPQAAKDVERMGGAWSSPEYVRLIQKACTTPRRLTSLFPLSRVQAALRIAAGDLNNQEVEFAGKRHLLKGHTVESVHSWTEVRETSKGKVTEKHNVKRQTPHVVLLERDIAIIRQFIGDEGIAKLMEHGDAAKTLIGAVEKTLPPRYRMTMPEYLSNILDSLVPQGKAALPGKKAGLLLMQKHLAAAIVLGFTTRHDITDEAAWRNLLLSADMGCGKSFMSMACAEAMRVLHPTHLGHTATELVAMGHAGVQQVLIRAEAEKHERLRQEQEGVETGVGTARAYTVILNAPNHLIGERSSLEEWDANVYNNKKNRLKLDKVAPHVSEWRSLLPDWHTEILETPSQVARFYARAEAFPNQPIAGFISLSKFSLASGRDIGVETRYDKPLTMKDGRHAELYERALAAEAKELEDLIATRKEEKKAQRVNNANGETPSAALDNRIIGTKSHLISSRTLRRDRLFRAGVAHDGNRLGQGAMVDAPDGTKAFTRPMHKAVHPVYRFKGVLCPTCGRRALKPNGEAHTAQSLYAAGTASKKAACMFCGTMLAQRSRKFDNVGDRDVELFKSTEWKQGFATEKVRAPKRVPRIDPDTGMHLSKRFCVGTKLVEGVNADGDKTMLSERTYKDVLLYDLVRDENGDVVWEETTRRVIPWGERPSSNPRMPLGEFIALRFPGKTDLFIADECHMNKGRDTDRGSMFGKMIEAAHHTLGLTGTLYGGKASTVFSLLMRMGNTELRELYQWKDEGQFVKDMGVIDEIQKEYESNEAASETRGKSKTTTTIVERPGITAKLAAIIQEQAAMVRLEQMGFNLVEYVEGVQELSLSGEIAANYSELVSEGKAILREPGGKDALSSYLQSVLTYCYAPWAPVTIRSKKAGSFTPVKMSKDLILPHHEWLAKDAADNIKKGRRVLVFCEHTNKLDIMPDIQAKITAIAKERYGVDLKVGILRSTTVKPGSRVAWFAAREEDGTNVVLCHPQLVETGLNLIGWPSIRFLEPTYKLATAMQARKRAYRPTQTMDCDVTWACYRSTMIEQAIGIIGRKALSAGLLAGDSLTSGLLQFDEGMSLLQQLAKQVQDNETGAMTTIDQLAEVMRQAGEAVRDQMNVGIGDLVGIAPDAQIVEPIAIESSEAFGEAIVDKAPVFAMVDTLGTEEEEVDEEDDDEPVSFGRFITMRRTPANGQGVQTPEGVSRLEKVRQGTFL